MGRFPLCESAHFFIVIYSILRMKKSLNGKASLPRDILARAFAGKVALERLRNSIAQMPNLYIQIKT